MKKLFLLVVSAMFSLLIQGQPPLKPTERPNFQGQGYLPNQFRDFVEHQQRFNTEKPEIVKKDGKVIITMSEEQFERMRKIRQMQRMRMVSLRQQSCPNCQRHHVKPPMRKI